MSQNIYFFCLWFCFTDYRRSSGWWKCKNSSGFWLFCWILRSHRNRALCHQTTCKYAEWPCTRYCNWYCQILSWKVKQGLSSPHWRTFWCVIIILKHIIILNIIISYNIWVSSREDAQKKRVNDFWEPEVVYYIYYYNGRFDARREESSAS